MAKFLSYAKHLLLSAAVFFQEKSAPYVLPRCCFETDEPGLCARTSIISQNIILGHTTIPLQCFGGRWI